MEKGYISEEEFALKKSDFWATIKRIEPDRVNPENCGVLGLECLLQVVHACSGDSLVSDRCRYPQSATDVGSGNHGGQDAKMPAFCEMQKVGFRSLLSAVSFLYKKKN